MRQFASASLIILLCGAATLAQEKTSLPSKEEAKLTLENAAALANLTGPGMSPFHIRMKTKSYQDKNKSVDGVYEMWVASPSTWHEEVSWTGAKFTRIVSGDRQWIQGEDTHRVDTDRFREITTISGFLNSVSTKQVVRLRAKDVAGGPGVCIDLKQPPPKRIASIEVKDYTGASGSFSVNITYPDLTVCLNLATGLAEEIDSEDLRWEFTSYAAIGNKRFPRQLRKTKGKNTIVSAEVEVLETFDTSQSNILKPGADVVSKLWCPGADPPEPTHFDGDTNANFLTILASGNSIMLPNGMGHLGFLYFDVDETGHVTGVKAYSLGRENPTKDSERKILMTTTFRPSTCRGKPVAGEYVLQLPEDRQAWP
jgi:hypothetical protein